MKPRVLGWQGLPRTKAETVDRKSAISLPGLFPVSVFLRSVIERELPLMDAVPFAVLWVPDYFHHRLSLCAWKYNIWYHGSVCETFTETPGRTIVSSREWTVSISFSRALLTFVQLCVD